MYHPTCSNAVTEFEQWRKICRLGRFIARKKNKKLKKKLCDTNRSTCTHFNSQLLHILNNKIRSFSLFDHFLLIFCFFFFCYSFSFPYEFRSHLIFSPLFVQRHTYPSTKSKLQPKHPNQTNNKLWAHEKRATKLEKISSDSIDI